MNVKYCMIRIFHMVGICVLVIDAYWVSKMFWSILMLGKITYIEPNTTMLICELGAALYGLIYAIFLWFQWSKKYFEDLRNLKKRIETEEA